MIKNEQELKDLIASKLPLDAIVVEGYDGVGKGKVLKVLADWLSVEPYRPDYNLWQKYDHRIIDRWKVSGFFWDIYSHFNKNKYRNNPPMLFDRGVISGAVYNNDYSIASDYSKMIDGMNVLHILVTCSEEDYRKFSEIRGVESATYAEYIEYTQRYVSCLECAGVDYVMYSNQYSEAEAEKLSTTCAGCGHYSHGWCRHPEMNCKVTQDWVRCKFSADKEVQDIHDTEMQCVQSRGVCIPTDSEWR